MKERNSNFELLKIILTIILVLTLCKPVTNWTIENTKFDEFIIYLFFCHILFIYFTL